ncbi:MAG: hypothetical protein KAG12_03410, partial [Desulfuromusa sp.]|nr:hypothetical protein [Desulfuromusa sp.]
MVKRFSVIVIPEEDSKVRRICVRSGLVKFGICCSLIVAGLFSFFAYSYFNFTVDHDELLRLRVATSQQRQSLQRLVINLEEVQQQMGSLA